MEIQNENTLIHAMKTGINVFVGAGFSLYAYGAPVKVMF